uniref:Uncharacterized protein n=1 Tax=Oryza meridionalis TaxID=40149 RepID=A0A0E0BZB6_9ORYZ
MSAARWSCGAGREPGAAGAAAIGGGWPRRWRVFSLCVAACGAGVSDSRCGGGVLRGNRGRRSGIPARGINGSA